jgi:hypothetical protein
VELETFLVKEIDVSAGGQRPWEDKKLVWGEKNSRNFSKTFVNAKFFGKVKGSKFLI